MDLLLNKVNFIGDAMALGITTFDTMRLHYDIIIAFGKVTFSVRTLSDMQHKDVLHNCTKHSSL
jgi:hypothetical protein